MIVDWLFDKAVKCGNPYHGEWIDGVLTLPNGDPFDLPTDPRGGIDAHPEFQITAGSLTYGYWPSYGDCLLVKIDGLPEPETTEEEADAGLSWKNYALLSGANHLFYGQQLGPNALVYLDPDNQPWKCAISQPYTVTANFQKLGHFHGSNTLQTVYATPPNPGQLVMVVGDADSKGRKACMLTFTQDVNGVVRLWSMSPRRVEITGTPGVDAAVSVTKLTLYYTTGSGSAQYDVNNNYIGTTAPGNAHAAPNAGIRADPSLSTVHFEAEAILFDGDIEREVHQSREDNFGTSIVHTFSVWPAIYQSTYTFRVHVGDLVASETMTVTETWYDGGARTLDCQAAGLTNDGINTFATLLIRRSSKVWEWVLSGGGTLAGRGADTGNYFSLALVMPDRIERTNYLIPASSVKSGRHFSYHPATKALISGDTPRCFL